MQQPSGDTIEVVINEVLTLSVIVEKFNLPINIVWKFNGEDVSDRNIFSINLDEPPAVSIFSLNPASSPIESGIYEVVVNNSVGTERVVFNVTVTGKPGIDIQYSYIAWPSIINIFYNLQLQSAL